MPRYRRETMETALAEAEHCEHLINKLHPKDKARIFYAIQRDWWLAIACELEGLTP